MPGGACGRGAMVAQHLAKVKVAGSSPVVRFSATYVASTLCAWVRLYCNPDPGPQDGGPRHATPRSTGVCKGHCECSSVGRASASQAEGRGFETRRSLHGVRINVPGQGPLSVCTAGRARASSR